VARQRGRIAVDLRGPGRDASGVEIALTGTHTRGLLGDGAHFGRLQLETVVALGGWDRALILRGVAAVVEPLGSGFIPFDDMVAPTGATGMRGFPMGRFRDRSGIVGTVEWRWLVNSAIDASLFTDAGTVAGPWFAGLAWQNVFPSFGGGLRFFNLKDARYWKAEPMFGVQIAYAPAGNGVRLLLTAAAF
jgi:outer membrane protein assembly factor BamA